MRQASRHEIYELLVVVLTSSDSRVPAGIYRPRPRCQFLPHQVARCPKIEGDQDGTALISHVEEMRHHGQFGRFSDPGEPR